MKNILALILIASVLMASKCKRDGGETDSKLTTDSSITIKKTGCFGTCPTYTFTIDGTGKSTYKGDRFVLVSGEKEKQFSAEETNSLFAAFAESDYWSYEDKYSDDRIADLPSTYLTYTHGGQTKEIRLEYEFPEKLEQLAKMTENYANSEYWIADADGNNMPKDSYIKVKTTGCFGTCPIYEFQINGDGTATYNGERFVAVEGDKKKEFSFMEANLAFDSFRSANFWSYEDEYTGNVSDLPTTFLTFSEGGKTKTIKLYYDIPDELKRLSEYIKNLANSEGWVKKPNEKKGMKE